MVDYKLDVLKNATYVYLTIDGNVDSFYVPVGGKALVVVDPPSSDVYVRFTKSKDRKGHPIRYLKRIEEEFEEMYITIENYVSETIVLAIEHAKIKVEQR